MSQGQDPAEVARLRESIEDLDAKMLRLLAERFRLVAELARWKRGFGLPIEDAEREAYLHALHERLAREQGLDPEFVQRLFETILGRSKERQRDAQRSKRA